MLNSLDLEKYKIYLLKDKGYSVFTVKTYLRMINRFLGFLEYRQTNILEINDNIFYEWITYLRGKKKLGNDTINLYIFSLKSFIKWIYKHLGKNINIPKLASNKTKIKRIKVLTPDQVIYLLDFSPIKILDYRDKAILECLYSSGFRVSELTSLKLSQICTKEGMVLIDGKGDKKRWVPIGDKAIESIFKWIDKRSADSEYIFTTIDGLKVSNRTIQKRVAILGERLLGIKLSPHKLRHALATHLLSDTQDIRFVQEILGHSQIKTTQKYTHLDLSTIFRQYNLTHPKQKKITDLISKKD